jgi:NADH-quinone oxidoreductase subunit L
MNLFILMMSILVLADNYLLMFVGWEGVGLCSYLLIGYYFDTRVAGDAAKKAFIVNRIGDFGFLLGMFLIFETFGSVKYATVFAATAERFPAPEAGGVLVAITLLLFLGATGKSAQIPLFVWLPDAMAGPTPVSALIHAATMVTAGVYMIARSAALYSRAPETMAVVASIGVLTALVAALIALTQRDIKKVLAYSTVSQLGYMFVAVGVGSFAAGIFHLYTHAFFKALLFLGSGSVILAMHHEQDMFKMGGLKRYLPVTWATMGIATLAIAGIPPLSGFFSKDEILWNALVSDHGSTVFWIIGTLVAALTAFYMGRLMFLTFYGEERFSQHAASGEHAEHHHGGPPKEPSVTVTGPLAILAILSGLGGLIGLPAWLGHNYFEEFLEP